MRAKKANFWIFHSEGNALHKFKVIVESIDISDHFPKTDTFTGRLSRFYTFQELWAQMWCIKHIRNANTLELVYLFKNLLLYDFSRKPTIKWSGEWPYWKKPAESLWRSLVCCKLLDSYLNCCRLMLGFPNSSEYPTFSWCQLSCCWNSSLVFGHDVWTVSLMGQIRVMASGRLTSMFVISD